MERQAIPDQMQIWKCPVCGKAYYEKEKAESCAAYYDEMQKIADAKLQPWRWFKLISKRNLERVQWQFVQSVSFCGPWSRCGDGSCFDRVFRLDDTEYRQYTLSEDWHIDFQTLSIVEGYQQHGLIPKYSAIMELKKLPDEVRVELMAFKLYLRTQQLLPISGLSRGELMEIIADLRMEKVLP